MLSGNLDEDKRSAEGEGFINYVNLTNTKDLETVLVFSLEDDCEVGMLGLLTERQVNAFTRNCRYPGNTMARSVVTRVTVAGAEKRGL